MHSDWTKTVNKDMPQTGKFLKKDRITIAMEIQKEQKLRHVPGPGVYNDGETFKKLIKVKGNYSQKSSRSGFTETAMWYSLQTPGPGEKINSVEFDKYK